MLKPSPSTMFSTYSQTLIASSGGRARCPVLDPVMVQWLPVYCYPRPGPGDKFALDPKIKTRGCQPSRLHSGLKDNQGRSCRRLPGCSERALQRSFSVWTKQVSNTAQAVPIYTAPPPSSSAPTHLNRRKALVTSPFRQDVSHLAI